MNKSYRKSELAELADVSYSTFYRFQRSHQKELAELGVSPKAQTVRGKALEYICREYNIELPEEKDKPRPFVKIR